MKREDLLKSKEYWMGQIQNDLFEVIQKYMEKNAFNRTQLAAKLNVTKGYVTQVLNGDFDHKISKLVELAIACNAAPLLYFTDLDKYIKDDSSDKTYNLSVVPENAAAAKKAKRVSKTIKQSRKPANHKQSR
ncbi:MAG: helix-turn-helix transcriptional regulator [Chitinophagaceae bacterium]